MYHINPLDTPDAGDFRMGKWRPTGREYCAFDTECDWHYWLLKFYAPDGRMYDYEIDAESGRVLNVGEILWFFKTFTVVGFNSRNYDDPMIRLALAGANVHRLKQCNDTIITRGVKPWQIQQYFPEMWDSIPDIDHIDISEPTPGVRVSLKAYMGRMHSDTIQDLPFDPNTPMPAHMRAVTAAYCGNDLIGTDSLRRVIQKRLDLRVAIGAPLGVDLRSKSDAQMAEAMVKARMPNYAYRTVPDGYAFRYVKPAPLRYTTAKLQAVLDVVLNSDFRVYDKEQRDEELYDATGKVIKTGVKIPPEIKGIKIAMGKSVYKLGIGGLHSQEKAVTYYARPGVRYREIDVKSYYPNIIRMLGMYPAQLGPEWLKMYCEDIVERLRAKAAGEDTRADGLKIFLNGLFGKLFSKYSCVFAPEMGIAVTMTGQLYLLMLIEALELAGIHCVSANTDGLVCEVRDGYDWIFDDIVTAWERNTGLEMEHGDYKAIHMASVNSYVAITPKGKTKTKGMFAESGVLAGMAGAHPDRDISIDAVVAFLSKGTPIAQTIRACQDVRKFVSVRGVKGGGEWNGEFLGKVVRWYYSTDGQPIRYVSNGNKVADSDGCTPAMKLPSTLPANLNYATYETYALKLLEMVGYYEMT